MGRGDSLPAVLTPYPGDLHGTICRDLGCAVMPPGGRAVPE